MIGIGQDIDGLVGEACADSPIDPTRPEHERVVLLMLAMYNIVGTMDWTGDWASAIAQAFARAGAKAPKRSSLRWYRTQLVGDPERFRGIRGADDVLIDDLLHR